MDFKKLDDIVENFVRTEKNQTDIENLPKIIPLCEEIISNKDFFPVETEQFSTNYNLNKKIQLISEFLGTIDISLKNQFNELIRMLEKDGTPTIRFDSKRNYSSKGRSFVHIENNLYDMFIIIHETFHVINYHELADEDGNYLGENYMRHYYGEAISILAEKLFGEYLVNNGYITENDYNIIMNKRLDTSKDDAKAVIIEGILIDMKKSEIELNYDNIKKYVDGLELSPAKKEAVTEEFKFGRKLWNIIDYKEMQFPVRQRYVIAQSLLDKLNIKDFARLNYVAGSIYADLLDINEIMKK